MPTRPILFNSARTAANTAYDFIAESGIKTARPATSNPMTVVKTIMNQLGLVDLGITAVDSPATKNNVSK